MRRTSLLLFVIAPLLLVLLLAQLADPQAAQTLQADSTPAAEPTGAVTTPDPTEPAAEPAEPTVAALPEGAVDEVAPADDVADDEATGDEVDGGVDAAVPLTPALSIRLRSQVPITLSLAASASPTETEVTTNSAEAAVPLLSASDVTTTVGSTGTAAVDLRSAARASAAAAAPATTGTVTTTPVITGAEILTDVLIPLTDSVTLTAADALTTDADITLTVETTATGTLTDVETTLLDLPEGPLADDETPLLTAPTEPLTGTEAVMDSMALMLDLDIQFIVTDTLTSTVPATLVIKLSGMPTLSVPISLVLGTVDEVLVNVEPVTVTESLTDAEALTDTEALTDSDVITLSPSLTETEVATEATPVELTPITVTVPVTTNLRPGPGTNFDPVGTVPAGTVLTAVAIDATSEWLLLDDGNWIAVVIIGEAPEGLTVATPAIVTQVREEAAQREPTPTPTPAPPTATPTPLPPSAPLTGTTTTNANLRAGPGTTFDIVGNTVLGQQITVDSRNEAGDWLRLDTGAWISASLVAGITNANALPVFDPNATPTPALVPTATPPAGAPVTESLPVTATTPATGTTDSLLPTATPSGAAAPATTPVPAATPAPLSVEENLYLVEFDTIARKYGLALTAIDRLVDSATGNEAVLADQQWGTDMNTAIQLLRGGGTDVARAAVPDRFESAHTSLVSAATQYNAAAELLSQALQQQSVDRIEEAFGSIALGDAQLAQATSALSAFRP